MRDNHDRMPELLTAYERDGQFFGAAAVTLGSDCRQFEFGLPHTDYTALRRILQSRPFDQLPGLRYRYFVASRVPAPANSHSRFRSHSPRTFFGLRGSETLPALPILTRLNQNPESPNIKGCSAASIVRR
jgi:hypothetical protein